MVLASMADVGQRKELAVQSGLPALLRRTRSRQGRRRISPSLCCVLIAVALVPGAAFAAPPPPDPPPPGVLESAPTRLSPDVQPPASATVTAVPVPAAAPPSPAVLPGPVDSSVAPVVETSPPARGQARSRRVSNPPAAPVRPFVHAAEGMRRPPPAAEPLLAFSVGDTRPSLLAAFSLAVLVLGSGTLIIVLARLQPARRGLA